MWSMQQLADEMYRERLANAEQQRPARQQRATASREPRDHLGWRLIAAAGRWRRMSTQPHLAQTNYPMSSNMASSLRPFRTK